MQQRTSSDSGIQAVEAAGPSRRILLVDDNLDAAEMLGTILKIAGHEVARRLRPDPDHEGMFMVAATGYGKEEDRHRGQAAGFHHHLIKPVDPGALQALLANIPDMVSRTEPVH